MKPRLVSREAFTVVGFKCRASKQNNVVPRLWDDFNKVCAGIPHSVKDRTAYGVCYLEEGDAPSGDRFSYLAGVEVSIANDIPRAWNCLWFRQMTTPFLSIAGRWTICAKPTNWSIQNGFPPARLSGWEIWILNCATGVSAGDSRIPCWRFGFLSAKNKRLRISLIGLNSAWVPQQSRALLSARIPARPAFRDLPA